MSGRSGRRRICSSDNDSAIATIDDGVCSGIKTLVSKLRRTRHRQLMIGRKVAASAIRGSMKGEAPRWMVDPNEIADWYMASSSGTLRPRRTRHADKHRHGCSEGVHVEVRDQFRWSALPFPRG